MQNQNQKNNTAEIFRLATYEIKTGTEGFGLTAAGVDSLAGCIGTHAKTEDAFVDDAKFYADNFFENVERAIEAEPCESDLNVLQAMLAWTYDEAELEKLARLDWQEYHPAE